MELTKPTGVASVGGKLRELDQWFVRINGGSGPSRIKFGSATGVLVMVLVLIPLIACIVINVREGRFIIPWPMLLSTLLLIIPAVYGLRTPAKDQAQSDVPHG
jgi:hypothetical protein